MTDGLDLHEVLVEPGRFTAMIRAYDAVAGSQYKSGIVETFTSPPPVPFDRDLSSASAGTYPNANASGTVLYEESTSDLSAIRSAIGSELRLEEHSFQAYKNGPFGTTGRLTNVDAPNPRPGQVEVRAMWSRDSIKVAGIITGTNYGRDRTVYTQKVPVEVRIAIVGGSLADKMRRGEVVPFSTVHEAARH